MINSRTKGLAFEREIARRMRPFYPEAKRGLQYQAGDYAPDVMGTPYYIECKRGKTHLSLNDGGKAKKYNPHCEAHMIKLCLYYYERMLKYNGDQSVIIVWKLDRKPIYVTKFFYPDKIETLTWEEFEMELK